MNVVVEKGLRPDENVKTLSITRIATRGIINIFVPLMETFSPDNEFCNICWNNKNAGWKVFRQVNNKRRNSPRWKKLCRPAICQQTIWIVVAMQNSMAILLLVPAGHRFCFSVVCSCRSSSLPLYDSGTRHQHSLCWILGQASPCASRALIVTYRLWQLHERKSQRTHRTFRRLNDRNGWRNATLIAVTSKHNDRPDASTTGMSPSQLNPVWPLPIRNSYSGVTVKFYFAPCRFCYILTAGNGFSDHQEKEVHKNQS